MHCNFQSSVKSLSLTTPTNFNGEGAVTLTKHPQIKSDLILGVDIVTDLGLELDLRREVELLVDDDLLADDLVLGGPQLVPAARVQADLDELLRARRLEVLGADADTRRDVFVLLLYRARQVATCCCNV